MAGRQSTPATSTVDDLTGKLHGISIRSGGGSDGGAKWGNSGVQRSPASASSSASSSRSSLAEELVVRRGQHERRPRNPAEAPENGGLRQSVLQEEELESGSSGKEEKASGGSVLSREEREAIRFKMVVRRNDFRYMERVNGRMINVLQGLELHTGVFSTVEQKRIVDCIYNLQEKGRNRMLRARTYSEPRKWMRGKGRVTIQFGCCYNYAVDKNGNPPGIIRDEEVDPIPPLLKSMIQRMVAWHVLPPDCIPNSCIVNIYDEDDCIPPHIDHHDFVRPFCTVSFLSECNILFGRELKVLGPGEFSGSTAIPLPVGSVLLLSGNGADVAKHCVPAVPAKRISITFRKMDDSKFPFKFIPDPDLQNLRPLAFPVNVPPVQQARSYASPVQHQSQHRTPPSQMQQFTSKPKSRSSRDLMEVGQEKSESQFQLGQDDFPPLGSTSISGRTSRSSRPLRQ